MNNTQSFSSKHSQANERGRFMDRSCFKGRYSDREKSTENPHERDPKLSANRRIQRLREKGGGESFQAKRTV